MGRKDTHTSYGIFVELNVSSQATTEETMCYGGEDTFSTRVRNVEEPGQYFHSLLATLITGAARLMLALAERLAEDSRITWAFCDTDSMALARPKGMEQEDFLKRAESVREWFTALNSYERKGTLFSSRKLTTGLKRTNLPTRSSRSTPLPSRPALCALQLGRAG